MPPSKKWRDAANYEYLMDADGEQIAWEFLRRKNNYKKAYAAYSLNDTKSEKRPYHFSVRKFLDPAIAKIPDGDKGKLFRRPLVKMYPTDVRANKSGSVQTIKLPKETQVLLRFDLSRSIRLQLESAEEKLGTRLKELKTKGVVIGALQRLEKTRPYLYIRRLRIMDAQNAGARDEDIVANFSKDPTVGVKGGCDSSNLRSDKKEIKRMSGGGYRTLAHLSRIPRVKRAVTVQLADHASTKT